MSTAAPVDVDVLHDEIQRIYTGVSVVPHDDYIFPTGRAWADQIGYPADLLDPIPEETVEAFAGVANHFLLGGVEQGEAVLDLGCGAGMDLLVAAQMAGPSGRAIGVDFTAAMVKRARAAAAEMGLRTVKVHEGPIESTPVEDATVDVVISNGVIDLVPDKDAVFDEIDRVLRPGGRVQVADVVIQRPVSDEAKGDIDLWTG